MEPGGWVLLDGVELSYDFCGGAELILDPNYYLYMFVKFILISLGFYFIL